MIVILHAGFLHAFSRVSSGPQFLLKTAQIVWSVLIDFDIWKDENSKLPHSRSTELPSAHSIQPDAGECRLTEPLLNDDKVPRYAILSHMWGAGSDEVAFNDLTNGTDVSTAKGKADSDDFEWESAFRRSKWFTRGWTLQELLAPHAVEFFSQQCKRLGDKDSLRRQIHEITAIPEAALRGELLSQFEVEKRFSWMEHPRTTREEDMAYSLLGIFGVYIAPSYGEGVGMARKRLRYQIKKLEKCTRDLHVTDPRCDKARIEQTKGGLLEESYRWIFGNQSFLRWREDPKSRLLWIKGDPGKGMTMLLCGIINELNDPTAKTTILSYFFCQATDSRINSATAVLRGLLFMLTGKALFEDANAWIALSEIFTDILQDWTLKNVYFFVDALDECVQGLDKLLAFIVKVSSLSARARWILTSRNCYRIEQQLRLDDSGARLSLELEENAEQVSHAVDAYINYRVGELDQIQHDQLLQSLVREKLQQKAKGTFLWVSLVMKELKDVQVREVVKVLDEVPAELTDLYGRMMQNIKQLKRQNPELCLQILSTVIATQRPLHLQELCVLAALPQQGSNVEEMTMMGSCLQTLEGHSSPVYSVTFSHRSAYLASASDDHTVRVWDAGSGECVQILKGHTSTVYLVAFSHDLTRVAFASKDHTVMFWDMRAGECLHTIDVERVLYRISFDSTDRYLHTDVGVLNIRTMTISTQVSRSAETQTAQVQSVALGTGGTWITYGSKKY
ncbi:hypothetical protein COCVIDRAFT_31247 [Bipolaris victoriae FI3]|uniref:NACHT domain-containing protein n=1 Tax=Bipolaris victoriae (strain FI3) TaxID=930091 RepID=W7E3D3_BIPV3|nr:hypothetical protein COCVIDRAFT_31247 [Bipolaris victoriae FI3]